MAAKAESCTCDQPMLAPGQPLPADLAKRIDNIVAEYNANPNSLINILHEVQEIVGYLPQPVLLHVAEKLGASAADVHGVVSFYALFSMKPKGKHRVAACKGTACYVRGAPRVLERLEKELGIPAGDTTEDMLFSLEVVRCLGACGLGPVAMIDDDVLARLKPDRIPSVLKKYREA